MNTTQIREALVEGLFDQLDDDILSVSTFDEAGTLTSDEGVVVKTGDGTEFQITIVRSA